MQASGSAIAQAAANGGSQAAAYAQAVAVAVANTGCSGGIASALAREQRTASMFAWGMEVKHYPTQLGPIPPAPALHHNLQASLLYVKCCCLVIDLKPSTCYGCGMQRLRPLLMIKAPPLPWPKPWQMHLLVQLRVGFSLSSQPVVPSNP
jgi:hypothetical protein